MNSDLDRIQSILASAPISLNEIPRDSGAYLDATRNCENIVGTVAIPVGVAGPLCVNGEEVVFPLATTEGCLVASVNRGCKALNQGSGVTVKAERVGITRAPVFRVKSSEHGKTCMDWLNKNFDQLALATRETSQYLELLRVEAKLVDLHLFIRFTFDPKDAMGMNMAVIACEHLIKTFLEPELELECLAISGNWCADKKPGQVHVAPGRGFKVTAEATLSTAVVESTLQTTVPKILEVYESKIVHGSQLAHLLGANAHHANMVAALFLATGQDPAHVVEGSHGNTFFQMIDTGKLLISVTLPSILCGVIGGGTSLPKQREALELMGVSVNPAHPGRANERFAGLVGAAVLAGELSLMAALASQDLARAHSATRER